MGFPLRPSIPRCHSACTALFVVSFALLSALCLARPANDPSPLPRPSPSSNSAPPRPSPREQCFLYTELVHGLTQQAAAQLAAGDTDHATATLKQINQDAHLIHLNLAHNSQAPEGRPGAAARHHLPPRPAPPPGQRRRPRHRPGHPQAAQPGQRRAPHPGLYTTKRRCRKGTPKGASSRKNSISEPKR